MIQHISNNHPEQSAVLPHRCLADDALSTGSVGRNPFGMDLPPWLLISIVAFFILPATLIFLRTLSARIETAEKSLATPAKPKTRPPAKSGRPHRCASTHATSPYRSPLEVRRVYRALVSGSPGICCWAKGPWAGISPGPGICWARLRDLTTQPHTASVGFSYCLPGRPAGRGHQIALPKTGPQHQRAF